MVSLLEKELWIRSLLISGKLQVGLRQFEQPSVRDWPASLWAHLDRQFGRRRKSSHRHGDAQFGLETPRSGAAGRMSTVRIVHSERALVARRLK
jgi:hypothetical protein